MVWPHDITALLGDWSRGNGAALNRLLPLVYAELRRVAARQLRNERADHTLQPTALVHEVCMRLVDQRRVDWHNRAHFFGVAAQLMRRILVDHARRHSASKRGDGVRCVSIDDAHDLAASNEMPVLAFDHALDRLEKMDRNWQKSSNFAPLADSPSRKWHMCSACRHRLPSATGAQRKPGSNVNSNPKSDHDGRAMAASEGPVSGRCGSAHRGARLTFSPLQLVTTMRYVVKSSRY